MPTPICSDVTAPTSQPSTSLSQVGVMSSMDAGIVVMDARYRASPLVARDVPLLPLGQPPAGAGRRRRREAVRPRVDEHRLGDLGVARRLAARSFPVLDDEHADVVALAFAQVRGRTEEPDGPGDLDRHLFAHFAADGLFDRLAPLHAPAGEVPRLPPVAVTDEEDLAVVGTHDDGADADGARADDAPHDATGAIGDPEHDDVHGCR